MKIKITMQRCFRKERNHEYQDVLLLDRSTQKHDLFFFHFFNTESIVNNYTVLKIKSEFNPGCHGGASLMS